MGEGNVGKSIVWIAIILGIVVGATLFFVYKFQSSDIKEISISNDALLNGASFSLEKGDLFNVKVGEEKYDFILRSFRDEKIVLIKGLLEYELSKGEELNLDLNKDGGLDILVSVIEINKDSADFFVESPAVEDCVESWECTDWSVCINDFKKRVCVDGNFCETEINKPDLSEGCETVVTDETF